MILQGLLTDDFELYFIRKKNSRLAIHLFLEEKLSNTLWTEIRGVLLFNIISSVSVNVHSDGVWPGMLCVHFTTLSEGHDKLPSVSAGRESQVEPLQNSLLLLLHIPLPVSLPQNSAPPPPPLQENSYNPKISQTFFLTCTPYMVGVNVVIRCHPPRP